MIGVDKIEDIRRRARAGQPVARIAREVGVSEPTVRKYRDMEDLSERPPAAAEPGFPSLEGLTGTIDSWLEDDCRNWRKQRHTATRVYVRLREELGYDGSYSTVQRYVRRRREEMERERDERDAAGYLLLEWLPGECQVDFGEADFRVRGVTRRGKYLTVSFPHSNVGVTQVFWGETSECVCQGLRDAFEFLGGVPRRIVFDNATEVGRRVGTEIRTSDMFRRFAAHYGFDYTFTNPHSGNEKGNVENMVGAHRRNVFVPVPQFSDVRAFNRRLRGDCMDLSDKRHYRVGTPQLELFEEDRAALSPLPPQAFSCVRWERRARRCNKQGDVVVGGIHRYNAGPALARSEVVLGLGAFDVTILDAATGEVVATYEREWGDAPTSSADPTLQLRLLCMRPGGWRDSVVRGSLPGDLVAFLDSADAPDLAADLRVLRDVSEERGFAAAVEGMSRSLSATGGVDPATVSLAAAVAASGDERVEYDEDVDLSAYDGALRLVEGGAADADEQLGA
ncbi:MAG: IS21 family transposase [Parafannyhessea umbonata]|nr:IS21 family transposase [Parafannyhessea umbonata]